MRSEVALLSQNKASAILFNWLSSRLYVLAVHDKESSTLDLPKNRDPRPCWLKSFAMKRAIAKPVLDDWNWSTWSVRRNLRKIIVRTVSLIEKTVNKLNV